MATLVFSAVGTALGGPVGGAIGSLIGQSFDQQFFGSARRGPRLGDLAVQTSTYGTQVPRLYGTMRVAGSVIWATDLTESSAQVGAKGQPETTVYSYSVSMAVALSSRPVRAVKRIWADGKLLRGEAGDFKVSTEFRLYNGGEDQGIDPLIAAIEGIEQTPAYRGVALAVFENLELAEYGNRIPFLTFEVEADEGPAEIGEILTDASAGAIVAETAATVGGFAAYGSSIRAAIEPLVERFDIPLVDDGGVLRTPAVTMFVADDVGNSANGESAPRLERSQAPARSVPVALTLSYYDPFATSRPDKCARAPEPEQGPRRRSSCPRQWAQARPRRWLRASWRGAGRGVTGSGCGSGRALWACSPVRRFCSKAPNG